MGDAIAADSRVIEAREHAPRYLCRRHGNCPQGQDRALGGATPESEAIPVKQVEPAVSQGSSYLEWRQHHFARYVDTLGELPATYRKSPRDRNRPLIEILKEARDLPDDKKGMSASVSFIFAELDTLAFT